jgi:hypothetical protein
MSGALRRLERHFKWVAPSHRPMRLDPQDEFATGQDEPAAPAGPGREIERYGPRVESPRWMGSPRIHRSQTRRRTQAGVGRLRLRTAIGSVTGARDRSRPAPRARRRRRRGGRVDARLEGVHADRGRAGDEGQPLGCEADGGHGGAGAELDDGQLARGGPLRTSTSRYSAMMESMKSRGQSPGRGPRGEGGRPPRNPLKRRPPPALLARPVSVIKVIRPKTQSETGEGKPAAPRSRRA